MRSASTLAVLPNFIVRGRLTLPAGPPHAWLCSDAASASQSVEAAAGGTDTQMVLLSWLHADLHSPDSLCSYYAK